LKVKYCKKELMEMKFKDNFSFYFENVYPAVGALIILGIKECFNISFPVEKFDKILDGAINFSSIIVGFIGVLLAILVSIKDTEIIRYIYSYVDKKVFMNYFRTAIITGLAVVVISSIMYIKNNYFLNIIWTFMVAYFILASYRIIDILLRIIFQDPDITEYSPKGNRLSKEEAERIRNKFKK